MKEFELKISEEDKTECTKFVQEICDMGYEAFEKLKPNLIGYQRKIITFFRLPKTPLHQRYMELMAEPTKKLKIEKEENRIKWAMKNGKSKFITDNKIEDRKQISVKYQIVSIYNLKEHLSWKVSQNMTIWIPYQNKDYIAKFAETITVNSEKAPNLFSEFMEKMPTFSWEPDIYINK